MTDQNEDRTVAFDEHALAAQKERPGLSGLLDVPKARLTCLDPSLVDGPLPGGGILHLVPGAEQTVGRGETCTYPIVSRKLSRQHARVFGGAGAWGVEDLNSTNGVRVNDQKVTTAWLKQGDVVKFGPIPFQFELERPESGARGEAHTVAMAADESEGERTMMFSGAQALGAANAVISADRAARKEEGPAVASIIVPEAPSAAHRAGAAAATSGGSRKILIPVAAAAVVLALVGGGVVYYPTYKKNQEIGELVERGTKQVERIVARSRDAGVPAPGEGRGLDEVKPLQPTVAEIQRLLAENPDRVELANLYARARFLIFERLFADLFNRGDTQEARQEAMKLRVQLDAIDRQLPDKVPDSAREPLKAAADLADLATILVSYHDFARRNPQIVHGPTQPTLEQLNEVDKRKKDFIQYRQSYNQVLSRDYRLLKAVIQEVENKDVSVVSRWREFLVSGR